jgi:hypothetical protein
MYTPAQMLRFGAFWGTILAILALAMHEQAHAGSVQVVVARYNEDLDWVRLLPFRNVVVYDKGDGSGGFGPGAVPDWVTVVRLPNVGREGHSYLWHIHAKYDRLADVTVFLPGSAASIQGKWVKARWVVDHVCRTGCSAFPSIRAPGGLERHFAAFEIHEYTATDPRNQVGSSADLLPSDVRPFGSWYAAHGFATGVEWVTMQGIFAVSRHHIHQRTREEYRRLLAQVAGHNNPETGHFLERVWHAVFHPLPRKSIGVYNPETDNFVGL